MKSKILHIILLVFCTGVLSGQVIHVPADQPTIQAGIDAAGEGDTVLVSEGTYFENISFEGKAITVASQYLLDGDTNHILNTIIDGSQSADPDTGSTVRFVSGEDTTSIFLGFTVQEGSGTLTNVYNGAQIGGGILCLNSGGKIINNRIFYNEVTHETFAIGGGIGCYTEHLDQWVVLAHNDILYNSNHAYGDESEWRSAAGGGVYVHCNAKIHHNDINTNQCFSGYAADGPGIEVESNLSGEPFDIDLFNNTIRYNLAMGEVLAFGGGLSIYYCKMNIVNNVISYNSLFSDVQNFGAGVNLLGWQDLGDIVVFNNNVVVGNAFGGFGESYGAGLNLLDIDHKMIISHNLFQENGSLNNGQSYGTVCALFSNLTLGENSEIFLDGNSFKQNTAHYGGAISGINAFKFHIVNNHFLGNMAENGGAVYLEGGAMNGIVSCLANNTLVSNVALDQGGAVYLDFNSEGFAIFNNIFYQNDSTSGTEVFSASAIPVLLAFSDIDISKIDGLWTGFDNISENPDLEEDFLHITDGSPCYNAGTVALSWGGYTIDCSTTDIDGDSRPMFGIAAIGADEYFTVDLPQNDFKENISFTVYPNPFTLSTTLSINLDKSAYCKIEVYNNMGVRIATIADQFLDKGNNKLQWQPAHLPAGIYFLRLTSGSRNATARAILHK